MSLFAIIAVLLTGGLLCALHGRDGSVWPRRIALTVLVLSAPLVVSLFSSHGIPWWVELRWSWIPSLGATLHLGVDGLSAILIALTWVLGVVSVVVSWEEKERPGLYFLNLLWVLAGVVGVFCALDLLLFFLFWEVMLVPMYFLIALWGYEDRRRAAMKFFLFTQASGMLLIAAIVACAWIGSQTTGRLSFDYGDLLGQNFGGYGPWLLGGFFLAFAVKLPVVPLHTWLPDAHTQAPTAGSVLLAGILLKTGAYGLIRFALPLFPDAAYQFAHGAMALGVYSILYGALLAYGQRDMKRLVAYSSVSHMGFVLLGLASFTAVAHVGVMLQLVAHGLSTGALFVLVGAIQARLHSRDFAQMGGLWSSMPRLSAFGLFFAIASLGLPGLANFVAEFFILVGTFSAAPGWTLLAALGLIGAAIYALALVQRTFHGTGERQGVVGDATFRETLVLGALGALVVWLGISPQLLIDYLVPGVAPPTPAVVKSGLVVRR